MRELLQDIGILYVHNPITMGAFTLALAVIAIGIINVVRH